MVKAIIFTLALLVISSPSTLSADNKQKIAAIVNDNVISGFDVEQRLDLVIAFAQVANPSNIKVKLRREILSRLIDESLQLQEAKKYDITVSEEDLDTAVQMLAVQNNLTQQTFDNFLKTNGIPRYTLVKQIRAEITWSKLLRRRFARKFQIGDEEINRVVARMKSSGEKPIFNISEIFLPVFAPEQEKNVILSAKKYLQDLRRGIKFAVLARQFSSGSTAKQGGAVGWVNSDQLSPRLTDVALKLRKGAVSEPIRVPGGVYLIKLHDKRRLTAQKGAELLVLNRLLLPFKDLEENNLTEKALQVIVKNVAGCDKIAETAKRFKGAKFGSLGKLAISDMPANIQENLKNLGNGEFSQPIKTQNGLLLIMICNREKIVQKLPDRNQIKQNLMHKKLSVLSQKYLRDLRRSAVIELR